MPCFQFQTDPMLVLTSFSPSSFLLPPPFSPVREQLSISVSCPSAAVPRTGAKNLKTNNALKLKNCDWDFGTRPGSISSRKTFYRFCCTTSCHGRVGRSSLTSSSSSSCYRPILFCSFFALAIFLFQSDGSKQTKDEKMRVAVFCGCWLL